MFNLLKSGSTGSDQDDERRLFPRRPAYGSIHGIVTSDHQPIQLELKDWSVGGVGAYTNRMIHRGASVMLSFPPDGMKRGFNARGRVVRCEPSATGYRIGIQFDRLLGT